MCRKKILASGPLGSISVCETCETYTINFNNVHLSLAEGGFVEFKDSLSECYEAHIHLPQNTDRRTIMFDTTCKGIRFVFNIQEVGELLSMFQKAELERYVSDGIDMREEF
ncbi:MAG: DUF6686 family protein [Bacteroidota bacterium]